MQIKFDQTEFRISAPEGGRLVLVFRSPATGTLGLTNVGGHFAPALKKAGYDLLLVIGKASKPVWLRIKDDQVSLEDATALWGQRVSPTEEFIKKDLGAKAQVISIGPAGENLVNFSCLMTHKHRSAGRGGGGALFGSKNLKAVGVIGTQDVKVADPEKLKVASKKSREEIDAEAFTSGLLKPFGTPAFITPSAPREPCRPKTGSGPPIRNPMKFWAMKHITKR